MRWLLVFLMAVVAGACARSAPAPARPTPAADQATTGSIVGIVRDRASGEPLTFATVTAANPGGDATPDQAETTDADGGFAIRGLAPGKYRVHVFYANLSVPGQAVAVTAGGEVTVVLDIDVDAEQTTVAAEQANPAAPGRRGAIAGRVIDQRTGEPIEGAVVTVFSPALDDAQLAVSDGSGEYKVLGLPPGTYTVSLYYSLIDYGAIEFRRAGVDVAGGETTEIPIRVDTSVRAATQ